MTYTYIPANPASLVIEHIERLNEDGSVSFIPIDPANSDYQAYLKSLEEN